MAVTNGWGQGVLNNLIEWGKGGVNNAISWGDIYADSYSGDTALTAADNLLLDQYSGAAAAYSVRKLSSSYSGSVLRVRRSSDNTEQDIGFDSNGDLDTSVLTTFVGANDGFVTTWYDQSGNGNDATQTTAASQPQIVSSGSVITSESLPTVDFDGSNDYLELTGTPTVDNLSIFNVFQSDNSSQDSVIFAKAEDSNNFISSGIRSNQRAVRYVNNGNLTNKSISFTDTTSAHQSSVIAETTTPDVDVWVDGSQGAGSQNPRSSGVATQGIIGARQGGLSAFNGKISEFVLYTTDETANRAAIESNINTYYNIYSTSEAFEFGNALSFDGVNDDVTFTSSVDKPQLTSGFSFSMWVRFDSAVGNEWILGSTSSANMWFRIDPTLVIFRSRNAGAATTFWNVPTFSTGTWYHIAVSLVNTVNELWINGTKYTGDTDNYDNENLSFDKIGVAGSSYGQFVIDELAMKSGAGLSQADVDALYNGGAGAFATDVITPDVYYRFNESEPSATTADSSGNSNTGTVTGATFVAH